MARRRAAVALAVFAALVLGAAGLAAFGWQALHAPLPVPTGGATLDVASGMGLRNVTADLAERGHLRYHRLLAIYGQFMGDATRIRAGEYLLTPDMTPLTLLDKLVAGEVVLHQLTIVEGSRFADMLEALRAHPAIVASTLDGDAIMAALGAPGVHPEGQFFPDTYRFARGTAELDVLRRAHEALVTRLEAAWRNRDPAITLRSEYDALVLASIIEKETALEAERPLIAGVFHRRLERNMRLQTDPTVIYGLGATYDGNLRRQDLDTDGPYNTYTRAGLPPTPIALPGQGSIEAAVSPDSGDAIYFVATGRDDGSHYFSATYEEHQRALGEYLQQLRSRDR
ncbi:MAG TPA: endolytic transglycosylase MltG [Gammaproteobacteria bacterium]|nr:endolytic transglycosylase MltG [Gammaproteobacteria bacterium]